jgi:hypothetical protein
MMIYKRYHTLRTITAILLFIGLANISGCKWGSWDLMGGEPVNQDESNGGGGNNGDNDNISFPPAVFTASRSGTKINEPFEMFSSFEDGARIVELTGIIGRGETGDKFELSPDGTLAAYLSDQNSGRFELFVVPVEGGDPTRISPLLPDTGDVVEFKWSPDSSQIAYLADVATDGGFELYTNSSEGGGNLKVSGTLPLGGRVTAFEWSSNSLRLAYIADQNNLGEFELFSTPSDAQNPVQVSRTIAPNDGDVTEFARFTNCLSLKSTAQQLK